FDVAAIPQAQQELLRVVTRTLALNNLGSTEREMVCQIAPKLTGQVGHPLDVRHTSAIDPGEELAGTKRLVSQVGQSRFEGWTFELGDIAGNHVGIFHVLKGLPLIDLTAVHASGAGPRSQLAPTTTSVL